MRKLIAAALAILVLASCSSVCLCPERCGCDCPAHPRSGSMSPEKK